jgi:TolA-binding protein
LIDAGDYAAAESSIKQMKVDFAKSEDLADSLLHFAWRCEQQGQRDIARVLYQDVSRNYSEIDPYRSSTAAMYTAIIDVDICKLVDMGDEVAVQAAITHLKSEFSSTHEPYYVMYSLAKVLHREALAISADGQYDTAKVRDYLKQAIAIYENEVIGKTDRADIESEAYRVSAQSYEVLGDYAKSVEYYQQSVDKYPKDPLSWHAQFMIGRNYENLLKQGLLSEAEAKPLIRTAYTKLLQNYPNCKAVTAAQNWLNRN